MRPQSFSKLIEQDLFLLKSQRTKVDCMISVLFPPCKRRVTSFSDLNSCIILTMFLSHSNSKKCC